MSTSLPDRKNDQKSTWNHRLFAELWLFMFIMVAYQVLWESKEEVISNLPLLTGISNFIGDILLRVTPSILNPVLHIGIVRESNSLVLPGGFLMSYWFYFSGLKQIFLVSAVFLILPGPWRVKLWYIPLNILIILALVLIRFVLLTLHCTIYPEHFHLLQDILFGPMFYLEILIMWIIWIAYAARRATLYFRLPPGVQGKVESDQGASASRNP